jgi:ABC-type nitrate/sulfonate/bicarbonate transport system ATPase subunit
LVIPKNSSSKHKFQYREAKYCHNYESGCGKSTLLKLIYGIHDFEGRYLLNDTEVRSKYNLVPGMPFIKYLSQDFDLMPYTTVVENVGKFLLNVFQKEKKNG